MDGLSRGHSPMNEKWNAPFGIPANKGKPVGWFVSGSFHVSFPADIYRCRTSKTNGEPYQKSTESPPTFDVGAPGFNVHLDWSLPGIGSACLKAPEGELTQVIHAAWRAPCSAHLAFWVVSRRRGFFDSGEHGLVSMIHETQLVPSSRKRGMLTPYKSTPVYE